MPVVQSATPVDSPTQPGPDEAPVASGAPPTNFLELFVKTRSDEVGKGWVAKALLLAFPDPEAEVELSYARAALTPLLPDLHRLSAKTDGTHLPMRGRRDDEPFLALAVVAAETSFADAEAGGPRTQLFRALVELLAFDPRHASAAAVKRAAAGLRLHILAVAENPTGVRALLEFPTAWQAVAWFESKESDGYFLDDIRAAWKNAVCPALRRALISPIPPPGSVWTPDASDDLAVDVPTPPEPDVDTSLLPLGGWILPAPAGPIEAKRSPETQDLIAQATLSTFAPLAKFAIGSTTVLSDAEMAGEMVRLMAAADFARHAKDLVVESKILARAVVATTGTAPGFVPILRWASEPGKARTKPPTYPGELAADGATLMRPELLTGKKDPLTMRWVHVPIPEALARRLRSLHLQHEPGALVFPALEGVPFGLEGGEGSRPTLATLRHTFLSRLMRLEPYGISAAQWVAGDDLGIDDAPLFYDRIAADRLVLMVARITFPWFGQKANARLTLNIPSQFVGSQRVPDIKVVSQFMASLRGSNDQTGKGSLANRLRRRTRNAVHGLALLAAHRPNNGFVRLRIGSFGLTDPVGVLADKIAGPDWLVRPVALPRCWREEFRSLLAELAQASTEYAGRALGEAAKKALAGDGPIFLDVRDPDDVRPFDLDAYREGLPDELLRLDNFARQLLNNRLTPAVPESLRVAQMGWHGTREGAWVDGSPWSVLTAAAALEKPLTRILRDVGWRPLPAADLAAMTLPENPIEWVSAEKKHAQAFRDAVSEAKRAMAVRQADLVDQLVPKLSHYLAQCHKAIVLSDARKIELADPSGEGKPIELSQDDQDKILRYLAGGDPRCAAAHAGRNWLSALIGDARKRGVIVGPIPRRVAWRWPTQPGLFTANAPMALQQARALDTTIAAGGDTVSEALRAVVALLIHGCYADVSAVLAALDPKAKLQRLRSEPGVLLVQPPEGDDPDGDEDVTGWRGGCLAFHALAALHLWRWHRGRPTSVPSEQELDRQLFDLAPTFWGNDVRAASGLGALREVAALARACNALRMDGWARPVGIGRVTLATVDCDRVSAARDDLLVGPRKGSQFMGAELLADAAAGSGQRRPLSLLDHLFREIDHAVQQVDADNRTESAARLSLIEQIRTWLLAVASPRAEDLVARFALALLERGGRRRRVLKLVTIQNYAYAVGRPLKEAMPDEPLSAEAGDWEAVYLNVVAEAEPETRPLRAKALKRFHWTLSQEFVMPDVSFADVDALAGMVTDRVDAGFLTNSETIALAAALRWSVDRLEAIAASPAEIHLAKGQMLAAHLALETASRPGETSRLRFADVSSAFGRDQVHVHKTAIQKLKTVNARRRTFFRSIGGSQASLLASDWTSSARSRFGTEYAKTGPVFHVADDATTRIDDRILFSRVGGLVRWATGESHARTYWLRKTGVRHRLEALLRSPVSSLWPTRDLLVEIGHGSLTVTLGSYTHDPITPFIRWFKQGWANIPAERIAIAVGLSASTVSRKRGGKGLSSSARDVRARVAALLESLPMADTLPDGVQIELPNLVGLGRAGEWSQKDMRGILGRIAGGDTARVALEAFRWPGHFAPSLERTLDELVRNYGISIHSLPDNEQVDAVVTIAAPRWLSDHSGVADLETLDAISPVLADMCDRWLYAAQAAGVLEGVPGSDADWSRWSAAVPALEKIAWDEQPQGRTLKLRTPKASKPKRTSPWPMLRWILLSAWVHERVMQHRAAPSTKTIH